MEYIIIYAIGAIATFALVYGSWFAYFQRQWALIADECYSEDRLTAFWLGAILAAIWPAGLPAYLMVGISVPYMRKGNTIFSHGFKFW